MEAGGVLRLLKGSPLTDPTTAPGPRHTGQLSHVADAVCYNVRNLL